MKYSLHNGRRREKREGKQSNWFQRERIREAKQKQSNDNQNSCRHVLRSTGNELMAASNTFDMTLFMADAKGGVDRQAGGN